MEPPATSQNSVSPSTPSHPVGDASEAQPRDLPRLPHLLPRHIGFATITSIRVQYDETIGEVRDAIAAMLHLPADAVELEPNFLETYHALLAVRRRHAHEARPAARWQQQQQQQHDTLPGAAAADPFGWPLPFPMPARLDAQVAAWETRLGALVRAYFASVADRMRADVFRGDERLCGGFLAAVPRRRLAFRLVEAVPEGRHSDVAVENGTLYVQTTVNGFGRAVERTADGLVERLGILPAEVMYPPDAR